MNAADAQVYFDSATMLWTVLISLYLYDAIVRGRPGSFALTRGAAALGWGGGLLVAGVPAVGHRMTHGAWTCWIDPGLAW